MPRFHLMNETGISKQAVSNLAHWKYEEEYWTQWTKWKYHCHISNIRCTLVGNKIVRHSDVVRAALAGTAHTTSSWST